MTTNTAEPIPEPYKAEIARLRTELYAAKDALEAKSEEWTICVRTNEPPKRMRFHNWKHPEGLLITSPDLPSELRIIGNIWLDLLAGKCARPDTQRDVLAFLDDSIATFRLPNVSPMSREAALRLLERGAAALRRVLQPSSADTTPS